MAKQPNLADISIEDFVQARKDALQPALDEANGVLRNAQFEVDRIMGEMQKLDAVLNPYVPPAPAPVQRKANSARAPRGSRQQEVLDLLGKHSDGLGRGEILVALGIKGDKAGEAAVSNVLLTMKKAGKIGSQDGKYLLA